MAARPGTLWPLSSIERRLQEAYVSCQEPLLRLHSLELHSTAIGLPLQVDERWAWESH